MDDQPIPGEIGWPKSPALWGLWCNGGRTFASVRIVNGVRECCPQCGERISADKLACVVTMEQGGKWLTLHFHRACYVAWERMEQSSTEAPADKVVTLSDWQSHDKMQEPEEMPPA